jgi:hypothetical protein
MGKTVPELLLEDVDTLFLEINVNCEPNRRFSGDIVFL